jgi:hypothetical protein
MILGYEGFSGLLRSLRSVGQPAVLHPDNLSIPPLQISTFLHRNLHT